MLATNKSGSSIPSKPLKNVPKIALFSVIRKKNKPMKRFLKTLVVIGFSISITSCEDILAEEIISSKLKEGDTIQIDFDEEKTEITVKINSANAELN